MTANLENSAVATGLEKVVFHSNPKERQCYHTVALISHASTQTLLQVVLGPSSEEHAMAELRPVRHQSGLTHSGSLLL